MSNEITEKAKEVFAKKLKYYMDEKGVKQSDIVSAFGLTASTVSDWCTAKKYPRVDKIQKLANYFGVTLSDLTDEKTESNELDEYLEQLRTRPEMKMLFSLTKNATKKDVEQAVRIIEALLGKQD